jgi:hypothetical protein
MEVKATHPRPTFGRVYTLGFLAGIAVGAAVTATVLLIMSRAWADCHGGYDASRDLQLRVVSPAVALAAAAAYAFPTFAIGRWRPRTAALLGIVAAFVAAYAMFIWLLPLSAHQVSAAAAATGKSVCATGIPWWWPGWLPH